MIDFRRESVPDLALRVARKDIAARELTLAALERIESTDAKLGAFVAVDGERALQEASAIDERLSRGEPVGPLAGIPIGVKDLEDAKGFRTTFGSVLHAADEPAEKDSVLVARLRGAGCVVLGKTNTPEHGSRPVTENGLFPPTRNPWDLDRSPGGSSGGSAAAVSAGMVPLATGSDGGGSIRIPSALCGLTGFKPSLGRVPSGGPTPPGWLDLSSKGLMARTVRDAVAGLDAAVGPEPSDLRSLPPPELAWGRSLEGANVPHRVGWAPTLGYAVIDREILSVCERAVAVMADLGAEIVDLHTVFDADPAFHWVAIAGIANERTIGHLRGTPDWERIDPEMRFFADLAVERVGPVELVRAFDAMHTLNIRLVELFHTVPVILTPTVAGQTPRVGVGQGTVNGELSVSWVSMTYPFNLTRSPAGTVCAGFTADGLPVGLQVIGPQHADVAVLRVLSVLESALALDTVAPVP